MENTPISVPLPSGGEQEEYAALDASLATLNDHHDDWVSTGLSTRIEYLRNAVGRIEDISMRWAKEATYFRGIDPEDPHNVGVMAEEILSGICPIARVCQTLLTTLESLNSRMHLVNMNSFGFSFDIFFLSSGSYNHVISSF
jgi:hypothetical protein